MKNVISIVKDFLYSAFIAILPTALFFVVANLISKEPSRLNTGVWLLFVFLILTVVIFIALRRPSRKVFTVGCLIFLLGSGFVLLSIHFKARLICKQAGGNYAESHFFGVNDIKGGYHSSGGRYSFDYVCYVSSEKLKEINPKAPFYKNVDFVIKD